MLVFGIGLLYPPSFEAYRPIILLAYVFDRCFLFSLIQPIRFISEPMNPTQGYNCIPPVNRPYFISDKGQQQGSKANGMLELAADLLDPCSGMIPFS